jgi:hypothetical protein
MRKLTGCLVLIIFLGSCAMRVVDLSPAKKAAPAQVKIGTGSQSAKRYAPRSAGQKAMDLY